MINNSDIQPSATIRRDRGFQIFPNHKDSLFGYIYPFQHSVVPWLVGNAKGVVECFNSSYISILVDRSEQKPRNHRGIRKVCVCVCVEISGSEIVDIQADR